MFLTIIFSCEFSIHFHPYWTLDTRGSIIFIQLLCVTSYIYLAKLDVLTRYCHFRLHRFCPICIYTLLYKGAILFFTLLIRNISGICTDFNLSGRQLIKSILDITILLSYTIKDFINIMIQFC